jgi:hypothetical protein
LDNNIQNIDLDWYEQYVLPFDRRGLCNGWQYALWNDIGNHDESDINIDFRSFR